MKENNLNRWASDALGIIIMCHMVAVRLNCKHRIPSTVPGTSLEVSKLGLFCTLFVFFDFQRMETVGDPQLIKIISFVNNVNSQPDSFSDKWLSMGCGLCVGIHGHNINTNKSTREICRNSYVYDFSGPLGGDAFLVYSSVIYIQIQRHLQIQRHDLRDQEFFEKILLFFIWMIF